jgi:hypothetical protein
MYLKTLGSSWCFGNRRYVKRSLLPPLGTVAFDPFLQAVISNYGQADDVTTGSSASIGQALRVDGHHQ